MNLNTTTEKYYPPIQINLEQIRIDASLAVYNDRHIP